MKSVFANLTLRQRITIGLAIVAVAAGIYALVHWQKESDFKPLYTGLSAEDAGAIVQKLKESGVEYRLPESGGAVLVPSARLAEMRLTMATAGIPKSGRIGFELFDKANLGATEFTEHVNYARALEGELERSVVSLAAVEQARVHITLPKESVFLDAKEPAKASVLVKIRPGAHLSPENVQAITHLVASAVEGLAPEAISVLDMNGNLLGRPKAAGGLDGPDSSEASLEYRHKVEADLLAKIGGFGRLRLHGRRAERGTLRSGALGDALFATQRRQRRLRVPGRRAGNSLQFAPARLAFGERGGAQFARDGEHHLPVQPHGAQDPSSGRSRAQDVGGDSGGPRSELAKG
jgi:flagellar basal-body M-ring protein/flagellar hook-basal body protein fliF